MSYSKKPPGILVSTTRNVSNVSNVSLTSIASTASTSDYDEFDYIFPDIDEMGGSYSDSMDSPQPTPVPVEEGERIGFDYKRSPPTPSPRPATRMKPNTTASAADIRLTGADCTYSSGNILICLDWDDTLHPTSAFKSRLGMESVRTFSLAVYETLLTLIRLYGASNICIVSNADKLWIEQCLNQLSAGNFVNIYHLISLYDIQIISAKNEFSKTYPNDSMKWKQLTFEHLVKKHYAKATKNGDRCVVVSIGDSQHEYIGSKRVIQRLNRAIIKAHDKIVLHRIKLLENPTLAQLIDQYQLIQKLAIAFGMQVHEEINIDYLREMKYFLNK
eukprot:41300_1